MLQYVRQLVTNCVCLLFHAEQVAHEGYLELSHCKQLPAAAQNNKENGKNKLSLVLLYILKLVSVSMEPFVASVDFTFSLNTTIWKVGCR